MAETSNALEANRAQLERLRAAVTRIKENSWADEYTLREFAATYKMSFKEAEAFLLTQDALAEGRPLCSSVTVLQRGRPPQEVIAKVECPVCHCVFQCRKDYGRTIPAQQDGVYHQREAIEVTCPEPFCRSVIRCEPATWERRS